MCDVSMQKEVKKGKDFGRRSRIVDRSFSPYIPVCRVKVFQAKGPGIAWKFFMVLKNLITWPGSTGSFTPLSPIQLWGPMLSDPASTCHLMVGSIQVINIMVWGWMDSQIQWGWGCCNLFFYLKEFLVRKINKFFKWCISCEILKSSWLDKHL